MSPPMDTFMGREGTNEDMTDLHEKRRTLSGLLSNLIALAILYLISSGMGLTEFGVAEGDLAMLALLVHWVVFVGHAVPQDSEKFFDVTAPLTYVVVIVWACIEEGTFMNVTEAKFRAAVIAVMALVWAFRLLAIRVLRAGSPDKPLRFEEFKNSKLRWLSMWTFQAAWSFTIVSPVLVMITRHNEGLAEDPQQVCSGWNVFDLIGWQVWLFGFGFQVVADWQKSGFRSDPENKDKFITTGLWAYSQHPNYFGEVVMSIGICISVSFSGCLGVGQFLMWFGPVMTFALVVFVSGIPVLEKRAEERFGKEEAYQWYRRHTPEFLPSLKRPTAYHPDLTGATFANQSRLIELS